MKKLKVLVGCEFSCIVRDAFIARGHDAVSCDLLPAAKPGPHIQGDVLTVLDRGWDLAIFHPPCTYLSSSGLHWNTRRPERAKLTEQALDFVRMLLNAPIPRIALENPVGRIGTQIRKHTQIIQPHDFGHDASKATCLWLTGLPPLVPTLRIDPHYACPCGGQLFEYALGAYGCPNCGGTSGKAKPRWANQTASGQNKLSPSPDRWKERSKTYQGIADAMAMQWG